MDEYSDDDLDQLPDSVLQELENNAIQFTQAQPPQRQESAHPAQLHDQHESYDAFDSKDLDEDLDTSVVVPRPLLSAGTRLPVQGRISSRPSNARHNAITTTHYQAAAHHGYGHVVPSQQNYRGPMPRPQNEATARSSQRFQPAMPLQNRPGPSQLPRAFAPPLPRFGPSQSAVVNSHPNAIAALEKRIRALEHDLNVTKGEASILRSNSVKERQAHEAELARLQAQHAEQLAKQQRLVETATIREKSATTELRFLERDMQEIANKTRHKDTGLGGGGSGSGSGSGATTPKKGGGRHWGIADGFEGADLIPSPTKGLGRAKSGPAGVGLSERTPTKNKRKRPAADSPILPLETHGNAAERLEEDGRRACEQDAGSVGPVGPVGPVTTLVSRVHTLPFDFLPLILDHASSYGQPPTFDILSQCFFPSDPHTSFSSIIFQSLPVRNDGQSPNKLLIDLSLLVINLWGRCVEEKLFAPIRELVSLLAFTLQLQTVSVAPKLLANLVAVAQDTLRVIASARMQMEGGHLSRDTDYQISGAGIDSSKIVSLLHLVALASITCPGVNNTDIQPRLAFWKQLSLDTVCLMLNSRQLLHDVVAMLDLLCTSVLEESIGPVVQGKSPEPVARTILNNVSILLTDPPMSARSPAQRHALASAALRTLTAFTTTTFGIHQVAGHNYVISRLVVALSEAVNDLYDQDFSPELLGYSRRDRRSRGREGDESSASSDVSGLCKVISQATQLLHTLVTDPRISGVIDINSKIPTSHGGSNRYQIALCRLTCAEEDLVLEAGIDTQTANRANELLELLLTPDEAKIIGEVFVSGG